MISYASTPIGTDSKQLHDFFQGWPDPPTPATHLRLLHASSKVVLARDEATRQIVGFITANTDGVLSAHISLLEVLPTHQGQGIGSELLRRMLQELEDLYMIDLICDPDVQSFYERVGMKRAVGMMIRNYGRQSAR